METLTPSLSRIAGEGDLQILIEKLSDVTSPRMKFMWGEEDWMQAQTSNKLNLEVWCTQNTLQLLNKRNLFQK